VRSIVVVGGSLAAVSAVRTLRSLGYEGQLTLVSDEPHQPYDKPPLSKECLRGRTPLEDVRLNDPSWYAEQGITVRTSSRATALDTRGQRLRLADGSVLGYDGLVVATGARARVLPGSVDGRPLTLRTLDDCRAIRDALPSARSLIVVGAGFIGLEVASTVADLGIDVTVIEVAPVPLAHVIGDELGRWFARLHRSHGVTVRCGISVERVDPARSGYAVTLQDGTVLTADLVVAAVGVRPRTRWLAGSGVEVGDGVLCDAWCRTSVPGVVAAGDVARWYSGLFDQQVRIEHWRNAIAQGSAAARSLIGVLDEPYDELPYFWSDQYDARLRFVGQPYAATDVRVTYSSEQSFVAIFGRDKTICAALCVNATSALATFRGLIAERVPWAAALDVLASR
jgi:NADPH-dependent 2,4-dienoyl-CoA reductase/sulfur reductase-like enzyme